MIRLNLHQAAAITGATLVGQPLRFAGVCTDSRADCAGRLFIALDGSQTHGEKYCRQALENGAVAVMVTQGQDVPAPQLLVPDTRRALSALASAWCRQVAPLTYAITGSNGKTTVKNMLASILAQSHRTHATDGNFNNEIGVPLTLLAMPAETEMAAIEMGAAQRGDIAWLAEIAPPQVAIVTNISEAHRGRFGSLEDIAAGKSELYQALPDSGVAVINRDDGFYPFMAKTAGRVRQITFGEHPDSDVHLLDMQKGIIRLPDGSVINCRLPVAGVHNVRNAAAAAAAAWSQGVAVSDIQAGLATFPPPPGRLQRRGALRGVAILDDSYNANPASVRAAIDVLVASPQPAWLVLGEMAELGEASEALHRAVGEYARERGVDALYAVGPQAALAADAMGDKGKAFASKAALLKALQTDWPTRGTVLFKASRSVGMEDVINELLKQEQAA